MRPFSPLNLPVRTRSGQALGRVVDVSIDPDTQGVVAYYIKASRLLPDMVRSPLIIGQHQVISITDQEMIVEDGVDRLPTAVTQPSS